MIVSIVAAMGRNRVIGKDNALPWQRIPVDMARFCELTAGRPVVMGRRTYESIIAELGHPLPNRVNIILTRNQDFHAPGCLAVRSVYDAITAIDEQHPELMVIGGARVYRSFLPYVFRMYLTFIAGRFDGDAYFPQFKWENWRVTDGRIVGKGKESPFNLWFGTFERCR